MNGKTLTKAILLRKLLSTILSHDAKSTNWTKYQILVKNDSYVTNSLLKKDYFINIMLTSLKI